MDFITVQLAKQNVFAGYPARFEPLTPNSAIRSLCNYTTHFNDL